MGYSFLIKLCFLRSQYSSSMSRVTELVDCEGLTLKFLYKLL